MKKTISLIALFAMVILLASSLAAAPIILGNFDNVTPMLGSYNGASSKVSYKVTTAKAKSGKKSLMVRKETKDYAGVVIQKMTGGKNNWKGKTGISMWVYGSGTGHFFTMVIEDGGKEQFMSSKIVNNFKGWKLIKMPFSKFKSRDDYQPSGAVRNRKIDSPVISLHFCATSKANFKLYFDDITVY